MRTLIINGSPKAKNGNTEIFIQKFINGMKSPCQISYVAKEDRGVRYSEKKQMGKKENIESCLNNSTTHSSWNRWLFYLWFIQD